ncbi:MSHA biogenesis protein MshI [Simiduia sp. 21SJ11W-1]|uniref:type IV pilus biogenesis protein PilM n=1 Tax=Simiduia sp. 21SJ11W-1 TaxID=2909669 RepID=UPI0020A0E77C|nr:MSHA biogenesis protein MshI [Simiduia sp. 21SJ11W-1]UTA46589.1 MSHA biogenesis protein MshI [Simiduia sp. 21SJ11W-1]
MLKSLWTRSKPPGLAGLQFREGQMNLALCMGEGANARLKVCETLEVEDDWPARRRLLSERVKGLSLGGVGCNLVLEPERYQLFMMEAPKVPGNELRDAIKWKVKDLISFPLEDAVIDVMPLPDDCGRAGQKLVYAVVAKRDFITAAIDTVLAAKLELSSIDIDEMSSRNLALAAAPGPRGVALVHIDEGRGAMTLVKDDCLYLSRNFALNYSGGLLDDLPVDALILELQRSFDYYERQLGQVPPAQICLYGEHVTADKITQSLRQAFFGVEFSVLSIADLVAPDEQYDEAILQHCASVIGASLRREAVQ